MKVELLQSSFENGVATTRQHLSCFVINNRIAIDAGSIGISTNPCQTAEIRNIVLTHAHIDHIAGLPLFIDDHFASIKNPLKVYATNEVISALRNHIFNWEIYPNFEELENEFGKVLEFVPFDEAKEFEIEAIRFLPISVNHKVPSVGFLFGDQDSTVAISGDTSSMDEFWHIANGADGLDAVLIECAFPQRLQKLAGASFHLTPKALENEIQKLNRVCPIYVINIKPMYLEEVEREIYQLNDSRIKILKPGVEYDF
ncbi:MAG: MBL fold metallo-hydrolase [Pyrinomonadaceae bacterium]